METARGLGLGVAGRVGGGPGACPSAERVSKKQGVGGVSEVRGGAGAGRGRGSGQRAPWPLRLGEVSEGCGRDQNGLAGFRGTSGIPFNRTPLGRIPKRRLGLSPSKLSLSGALELAQRAGAHALYVGGVHGL